jgi:phosphoglycolate phosphatase-like HAD superfamily hydrolase
MGSKKEHLALAIEGRYDTDKVIMIGDAPGDRKAAEANGVAFYPINPGHEEASWARFASETADSFFAGSYTEAAKAAYIEEFEALLPEIPPWKK